LEYTSPVAVFSQVTGAAVQGSYCSGGVTKRYIYWTSGVGNVVF
jgi:hypothetical protein